MLQRVVPRERSDQRARDGARHVARLGTDLRHDGEEHPLRLGPRRAGSDRLDRRELRELRLACGASEEIQLGCRLHHADLPQEVDGGDDVEPRRPPVTHALTEPRILEADARVGEAGFDEERRDRRRGIRRCALELDRFVDETTGRGRRLVAEHQRRHPVIGPHVVDPRRVASLRELGVHVDGEHGRRSLVVARDDGRRHAGERPPRLGLPVGEVVHVHRGRRDEGREPVLVEEPVGAFPVQQHDRP